ncbi:MAG TPA: ANTAR domain-containing protein [Streptosporangiaceae bacterium]
MRRHKPRDRVVVCSFIGCGRCWYCTHDLWSLCDNSNTDAGLAQMAWGYEPGAVFGCSHRMGGLCASLAFRSVIDQALGVIMAEQRCTAEEAFAILRTASHNRNVKHSRAPTTRPADRPPP